MKRRRSAGSEARRLRMLVLLRDALDQLEEERSLYLSRAQPRPHGRPERRPDSEGRVYEPRPISFPENWAEQASDRVPLAEAVLNAFVGRCQACGRAPDEQAEGSVLVAPFVLDGTLYGDTLCVDCFAASDHTDGYFLPPLI